MSRRGGKRHGCGQKPLYGVAMVKRGIYLTPDQWSELAARGGPSALREWLGPTRSQQLEAAGFQAHAWCADCGKQVLRARLALHECEK